VSGARRIGYHLSSEQFAAGRLVANAVAAEQAGFDQGSASGSLSAVQQLAAAIGSAAITSIWFSSMATNIPTAMITCLAVVAVVLVGCMALVGLLPRKAAEEGGH
jgi:hypothetical protein